MDGPEIIKTDKPCNCPWIECSVHSGSLCSDFAAAVKCTCPSPHFFGDVILADGLTLCEPCARAYSDFLNRQASSLMHDLQPFMPDHIRLISNFISNYWPGHNEMGIHGWESIMDDNAMLLGFISCFVDNIKSNPMLMRIADRVAKMTTLRDALELTKMGVEQTDEKS